VIAMRLETDVTAALAAHRVIPVATVSAASAESVGALLVELGLPCLEIALRRPDAIEAIRRAHRVEGLLVGAGTILTPQQAQDAADAGAAFGVAPGLSEDVVQCCLDINLPLFPGVATPSEIERARRLGLRTLKAFPIDSLGGAAFLRALAGVYPDVRFIPTGGINLTNLAEYLALANVLACAGSWLVRETDGGRPDELAARIRRTVTIAL
jgi:2-dehydro-3-deoxyphosphogluconate aldolase / (4S)-4-hydroxy-2-oxoglutarate aldolase